MITKGTKLFLSNGYTDFEDASYIRVTRNYEEPEAIADLFDCEFIIECEGERFIIEGWQAGSIEAA